MHSPKPVPHDSHHLADGEDDDADASYRLHLPTVDSNCSNVTEAAGEVDDEESPSNESSASWVGRKVDALFSPVLSFLHGAAGTAGEEEGHAIDESAATPPVPSPSVSSSSLQRSAPRKGESADEIDDSEDRATAVNNAIRNAMREAADDLEGELGCDSVKRRTNTDDSYDNVPGMAITESVSDRPHTHEEEEAESRYQKEKKALVDADGDVAMVDYYSGERPAASADSTDININDTESQEYETNSQLGAPSNDQSREESDSEDDEEEFNPYLFIKSLPPYRMILPPGWASMPKRLPPVDPTANVPDVCLVLDLDETLVHCTVDPIKDADMVFPVEFNSMEYQVHVRCRPYLTQFLEAVHKKFEVVVFTASQQVYADKLLDRIDPEGKYIKHRMFRDSCLPVEGNFLKDLTVLGRDLRKAVLVDNSPHAFGYQVDNGIPIESWFDDQHDTELLKLERFLRTLHGANDVRDVVRKKFQTHRLISDAE